MIEMEDVTVKVELEVVVSQQDIDDIVGIALDGGIT